jgi:glycosyltransferase involved in cell wall biosynthesis
MLNDSVSCLMVTANRPHFASRAIALFEAQTHQNRELVIIDDGEIDLAPIISASSAKHLIRYFHLSSESRLSLGELRNKSIDVADGEWCIQWDDDEWYHPSRIAEQLAVAKHTRMGSSALKWTLMHIDDSSVLGTKLFRGDTGIATPGTLLFRRDTGATYRPLARNEDGIFMRDVKNKVGLTSLNASSSHLFVRVFHGANTWDVDHFLRRLSRRPIDWPSWITSRYIKGDITQHRAFKLKPEEVATAEAYLTYLATHRLKAA